jgi:uncharacterized protein (TIGR03083 family)
MPAPLAAERLHGEIGASTAALAWLVDTEDDSLPVPSCPDWTLRQLATHVGRAHRWAAEIVGTRSETFIEFRAVPDGKLPADPAERGRWLTDGAGRLLAALRAARDAPVWAFGALVPAGFWARRMAHETLVHLADAQLAAGEPATIEAELAADAIDEWLTVMSGPHAGQPDLRAEALPAGSALHVHLTDPQPAGTGEWLIRNAGDSIRVLAEHGDADAELAGPAADVLLVLMRRLPPGGAVRVAGDAATLDRWLDRTAF